MDQIKQSDDKNSESARFSLSVDEWTSLKCRRYFNICIHHTDDTFYNLGLVYIPGKCGAKETKEIVEKRLQEFGLCFEQDIVAVTSDGPNVMVKFGRESPTEMVLCLNHAIHLSVIATFCKRETDENVIDMSMDQDLNQNQISSDEESEDDADCIDDCVLESASTENVGYIQNIQQALTETRALVTLFRKSPLKNITLQKYVKEEFGHELQLLLDVRTRWNSMMQMIERFLKLKNAIKKALIDLNMSEKWNDANTSILESLLNILHPVKLSVEALSRKDATILTAEAIIDVLINKLRSMENDLARQFVEHLIGKITERRNVNLISLVKYLHNPIAYNNENERIFQRCNKTTLIKYTEELYNRLYPNSNSSSTEVSDIANQDNEEDLKLDDELFELQLKKAIQTAETSDKTSHTHITRNLIKKEFQLFESTGQRTPTLEKMYKAVMTVKPTSTENERVFSLSGNIVSKIRNRLSDDAVNALVFLKAYFMRKKR